MTDNAYRPIAYLFLLGSALLERRNLHPRTDAMMNETLGPHRHTPAMFAAIMDVDDGHIQDG